MWRMTVALLAALVLVSVWTVWPSYGAVPKLDTIRVAIFINLSKYQVNTAIGTFSSAAPIDVGIRQPSGVQSLFQTKAGESIRLTMDDYKVTVMETTDFAKAVSVSKRLKTAGGTPFLTSSPRTGAAMYSVMEGAYTTAAAAKTAADKWTKDATLASLTGKAQALPAGPLHLEGSVYSSEADAVKAVAAFGDAGIPAFAAMKQSGEGKGQYTVLVGAASDDAGLAAVKQLAAAVTGGAGLKTMDTKASYVGLRDDFTVTESAKSPQKLISVPLTGTKVWLQSNSANGIKLAERYSRSYRGQFEISGLNSKLAIVNELPFEQYLYSVVGAEMPSSWPAEALKAQAVAARTYAIYQGFGFQIAHVVDSVQSQAYNGITAEKPTTIAAVDATTSEIAMYNGKAIETLFSSSAGGASADAQEIWGNAVPYLKSVPSPDESSEKGLYDWYRVVLPNGKNGYIREDLIATTEEKTAAGSAILRVKGDGVKVRPIPLIQDSVTPVATVNSGTMVVMIERVVQSNEMSWIRGPFTSSQLLATITGKVKTAVKGPITTLSVSKTGPSGRPTEILVNGAKLDVSYPDAYRSALGGLPSTFFTIDETARMTIAGANNKTSERTGNSSSLAVLGSDGAATAYSDSDIYIMNGKGEVRAASKEPTFRFVGNGYGHGVGLSQYGARGLADKGYDYKYILQYYYKDVTIGKD
ncbi:UNVERIFIED_CONTAM: stage II sporulation protein D [Paenibacillus phyllosphaerae]|nr:SpoIID/LytB domain-containing protein [Paenibacillus phyllosphaerae]